MADKKNKITLNVGSLIAWQCHAPKTKNFAICVGNTRLYIIFAGKIPFYDQFKPSSGDRILVL